MQDLESFSRKNRFDQLKLFEEFSRKVLKPTNECNKKNSHYIKNKNGNFLTTHFLNRSLPTMSCESSSKNKSSLDSNQLSESIRGQKDISSSHTVNSGFLKSTVCFEINQKSDESRPMSKLASSLGGNYVSYFKKKIIFYFLSYFLPNLKNK